MTDTHLLKEKMAASGYKLRFIAQEIGLSYQGMLNKVNNKHDFTAPEIQKLCEMLRLSNAEKEAIFFASVVD